MYSEERRDIHHGRNIKRFREAKGIKQETLAIDLMELFNSDQSRVARLEQKNQIDDNTLYLIAQYLKVDMEVLKNLEEDPARIIIENNTFESGSNAYNELYQGDYNNNPLEAILQLNKEKEELYERLLKNEKERNEQLAKHFESMVKEKNSNNK